jgi:hypothetical protein
LIRFNLAPSVQEVDIFDPFFGELLNSISAKPISPNNVNNELNWYAMPVSTSHPVAKRDAKSLVGVADPSLNSIAHLLGCANADVALPSTGNPRSAAITPCRLRVRIPIHDIAVLFKSGGTTVFLALKYRGHGTKRGQAESPLHVTPRESDSRASACRA